MPSRRICCIPSDPTRRTRRTQSSFCCIPRALCFSCLSVLCILCVLCDSQNGVQPPCRNFGGTFGSGLASLKCDLQIRERRGCVAVGHLVLVRLFERLPARRRALSDRRARAGCGTTRSCSARRRALAGRKDLRDVRRFRSRWRSRFRRRCRLRRRGRRRPGRRCAAGAPASQAIKPRAAPSATASATYDSRFVIIRCSPSILSRSGM